MEHCDRPLAAFSMCHRAPWRNDHRPTSRCSPFVLLVVVVVLALLSAPEWKTMMWPNRWISPTNLATMPAVGLRLAMVLQRPVPETWISSRTGGCSRRPVSDGSAHRLPGQSWKSIQELKYTITKQTRIGKAIHFDNEHFDVEMLPRESPIELVPPNRL